MSGITSTGARPSLAVLIAAVLATAGANASAASAQAGCEDVSGTWTVDLVLPGSGSSQVTLTLEQDECAVTGSIKGQHTTPIEGGEVEGSTVTFTASTINQANGEPLVIVWEGTVDENAIRGTLSSPVMGIVEFAGTKSQG